MGEALCKPGSRAGGYLAYCWMTMGGGPNSVRSGGTDWFITLGKEDSILMVLL